LNRIFRKYLEDNISSLDGFADDTLEDAMVEFETGTKRRFTGEEEDIIIRVPGLMDNADKSIKRQKLTLKGHIVKDLFKPVMTAITTLVECQLQQSKKARAIILVGGFGQSPYLRKCIQQVVGNNIEIMQPAYGWTAVVRGALLKALHDADPETSRVSIAARRARSAYGLEYLGKYDAFDHWSENQ
jgi:sugar (pentulose or hexulose) kinase